MRTPLSFEALRDQLAALAVPAGQARELVWVVPDRLGAAMTDAGAFEIFLLGSPLQAASPLVAGNLQHDRWEPIAGGPPFEASRVLLGSAAHFAAVAALIATELSRLDVSTATAMQRSFNEVEPIIELAIRRAALSSEAILGLIAELHVLRAALLATAAGDDRAATLLSWRGWAPGRDFVLGGHGIEVKATLGAASRHRFSGIHQLEPQLLDNACAERLHLMSFGLEPVAAGGLDLPELVDDLLSLLSDDRGARTPQQGQLLAMIASYGGAGAPSYEHDAMRGWNVYQQRFAITFARLYDVADPEMRLLDRGLVEQTFVVPDSLSFELAVPSLLSAFNPVEDWQKEIAAMARE
ncbi:PD-(D/E)XK motif protein [Mesorhizobium sp. B2-4-13]|uniref:PD-(D/E)XK motif protein n=1 Tax=Mesorhizobium sp. B2-4-13 TaxID=2589936 RepID=UPI00114F0C07|nr:PD-(D/E)XK motif protein [Mesorhizobium sp. B2-4-13]TPK87011.1 PD-(D/E)XK motif protein [Mesorhizobium sp. B2-4-13]